jgi:hypothetical protein
MQAQGGEEIKLHIPDLGLRWGEWSASRPGRALPPRKDSWYPLDRRILQKRRPQLRTTVLGSSPYDIFCSCNSCKTNDPLFKDYIFTVMFNDTPMISFGTGNTDKKMLTLLELSSRNTVGTLLVSYTKLELWVFMFFIARPQMYRIANLTRLFRNQEEILEESKLRIPSWVRVPVRLDPVARKLSTREERRQEQRCLFRRGDYRNHGHNHVYMSRVRVPVKMFPVARKPSRIKQRCQYMYVSGKGLQQRGPKPEEMSCIS